eukprot:18996-Heterococcus_DN1.PRE.2
MFPSLALQLQRSHHCVAQQCSVVAPQGSSVLLRHAQEFQFCSSSLHSATHKHHTEISGTVHQCCCSLRYAKLTVSAATATASNTTHYANR